ncbi:hypothetical protein VB779_06795 [Haloarculaceae archaeon H-GB11]|nr:hypothetical protein [Haloarculaceae archaeon H-GB11]
MDVWTEHQERASADIPTTDECRSLHSAAAVYASDARRMAVPVWASITPEGYTPSSLNEEGQLGRDDEEMLIQQGQLSQFTEEYIGPLAAQTEDSDIDDIEDLDEIEDTNQLMRATLPGVLLFAEVSGRVSNENWEELLAGDPKAGDTTRPRLSRYLRPIREAVAGLRHESKQRMAIGQNTIAPIDTRAAANCIGFVSFLVMGLAYSIVSMSLVGFSQRSISVAGAVGLLIGFFHLFRARYNERAHSGTS